MIDRIKNELQRNDSDIDDIITHAISDAIRHFKDEVFAVNQASFYGQLIKFDETNPSYSNQSTGVIVNPLFFSMFELPVDFSSMINLQVVKSGTNYEMENIVYSDLDRMDAKYDNPSTGTPTFYAFQGGYKGTPENIPSSPTGPSKDEQPVSPGGGIKLGENYYLPGHIRVFPHPDQDYTLALRYVSNLADPANLGRARTATGFWMNEGSRMIKCYAKGIIYSDYLQQFDMSQAQEALAESEYNRLVMRSEARGLTDTVKAHL